MAIKLLFEIGIDTAKKELWQEENERQNRMEKENNNKEKATKCWNKLYKLHKVKYQKTMPEKIDENYYDQYIHPILKVEFKDDKSISNIHLVGRFLSFKFSNSVAFKLTTYKGGFHT